MNSDTSAVQCGKAPELILLSKCHILTKDFFSDLSPHRNGDSSGPVAAAGLTAMLSAAPAKDLLREQPLLTHSAGLPLQQPE